MQTFYYYFLVVLDELLLLVDLVAFWLLLQIGVLNSSSSSSLIFNFSILTSVSKRTGTAFFDFNWGSLEGLSLTILGVTATCAPGYKADPCRIGDGSKFKFRSFLAKARDMAASLNTLVQYGIGFWKKKNGYCLIFQFIVCRAKSTQKLPTGRYTVSVWTHFCKEIFAKGPSINYFNMFLPIFIHFVSFLKDRVYLSS